jgi:hypothetical protein
MEILARRRNMKHEIVGIKLRLTVAVLALTVASSAQQTLPQANPAVTGKGTVDFIPMWDTTSDIINSVMFQKGSAIGIGTTAPAATLDVNGKGDIRDTLTLFPKSTDNTLAVNGTFFKISNTGAVTFIPGQKFPGTGTITGITTAAGSGLSGGGTTGTLSLKVPAAGITNAMLQNSKITLNANSAGGITAPGAMTLGGTSTIGLVPCAAKQVLQYSGTVWTCSNAGTGTITGITTAAGSGLAGGGTSGTLNLTVAAGGITNAMLAHSSLTVAAGPGVSVSGGGPVSLGGTVTVKNTGVLSVASGTGLTDTGGQNPVLAIDTSVVPTLSGVNSFTGFSDFDGNEPQWEVEVSNAGAGRAIIASNTSVDSTHPTLLLTNHDSTSAGDLVFDAVGPSFGGECSIDVTGNLFCTGTLAIATKAADNHRVGVFGVQSPENWIEDFGSASLSGGFATITLDPGFVETVDSSKADYHVFLTPAGECEGLYVAGRTATSFQVRELRRGSSNVQFDYRIVAHRKGLETARLPELNMGTANPVPQQDGHLAGSR